MNSGEGGTGVSSTELEIDLGVTFALGTDVLLKGRFTTDFIGCEVVVAVALAVCLAIGCVVLDGA